MSIKAGKGKDTCVHVVAIGSSTGGPDALSMLLKGLPSDFPVPILVTQHMPKNFLVSLSARIDQETKLKSSVAKDGDTLKAGHVYFAPGDIHMKIKAMGSKLRINLEEGPKVNHCIPSVDVMFDSLVALSPRVKTLAVMLTGMGDDGARASKRLFDKHNHVIVQDEASSTVWGMAGATVRLGAAHEILPLKAMPRRIMRCVECKA
ncbi:MAG: CheB methylesterase domain-containing protein [Ghiorsea sp.]